MSHVCKYKRNSHPNISKQPLCMFANMQPIHAFTDFTDRFWLHVGTGISIVVRACIQCPLAAPNIMCELALLSLEHVKNKTRNRLTKESDLQNTFSQQLPCHEKKVPTNWCCGFTEFGNSWLRYSNLAKLVHNPVAHVSRSV